jgi:hypothetical protein
MFSFSGGVRMTLTTFVAVCLLSDISHPRQIRLEPGKRTQYSGRRREPAGLDRPPRQENEMTKKAPKKAGQRRRTSKANHNRAERETLEERRQQELGRDTKPGGINSDKSRQPGTR